MSNSALVDTIRLEERMRREEGCRSLLLTLGNYSQSFIQRNMPFALDRCVTCSNFIGEAIEAALEYGFERILIIGHIGKMAKLGAGIMNTHSAQADGRMEVLVTCGLLAGADVDTLKKITECVTVDAAVSLLQDAGGAGKVDGDTRKACGILPRSESEKQRSDRRGDVLRQVRDTGENALRRRAY